MALLTGTCSWQRFQWHVLRSDRTSAARGIALWVIRESKCNSRYGGSRNYVVTGDRKGWTGIWEEDGNCKDDESLWEGYRSPTQGKGTQVALSVAITGWGHHLEMLPSRTVTMSDSIYDDG